MDDCIRGLSYSYSNFFYRYLDPSAIVGWLVGWLVGFGGKRDCVEGKEAGRCALMCMHVNKKELYCVVDVVTV